jgi:drug/metabolite transporter (DMT)-like permease
LGSLSLARGRGLVFTRASLQFYVVVAVLGTLVPNATFYISVTRLPAGIMSILISTVPLLAFPMALILGIDRFSVPRLMGLCLGLCGVLLIALPEASLPDPAMAAFLPLALVGPLFYAMEGTYVARFGTAGMDALQAMFGASAVGLVMCLPVVLVMDQWFVPALPFGPAEWGLLLSSALHGALYATYVWLASRAGAVFATQSSYIVTASGLFWSMVLLGERFSSWVWLALLVMLTGLALVQPRPKVPEIRSLPAETP